MVLHFQDGLLEIPYKLVGFRKTNSTTIVGLVAASPTITVLLTAPLGGQLADKYSRKKFFSKNHICFSILALL